MNFLQLICYFTPDYPHFIFNRETSSRFEELIFTYKKTCLKITIRYNTISSLKNIQLFPHNLQFDYKYLEIFIYNQYNCNLYYFFQLHFPSYLFYCTKRNIFHSISNLSFIFKPLEEIPFTY